MSRNSTLEDIAKLITEFTNDFLEDRSVVLSSNDIAVSLNLTRSSVSRYLNTLCNERKLIKIQTRPVVFLDVAAVEKKTGKKAAQTDFISIKEMLDYFNLKDIRYDFEDLVGRRSTLYEITNSLKLEINYPRNKILSIHFHGNKGTGKKKLAKSVLYYCIKNGMKDFDEKLYVYRYGDGQKDAAEVLFGSKEGEGFLAKARKGVLYIEGAECIPAEIQGKIADYLSTHRIGKRDMECIIFATEKGELSERLQGEIVSSYYIPDLGARTKNERSLFVWTLLKRESVSIDKTVKISSFAFQALSSLEFPNNIDGLHAAIVKILTNSIEGEEVIVKTYSLVDYISDYSSLLDKEGENTICTLEEMEKQLRKDDLLDKYNQFVNLYERFVRAEMDKTKYFSEASLVLSNISDHLTLNMNIDNEKINGLNKIIANICDLIKSKYDIRIYNDTVLMLSKITYKLAYLDSNIQEWSLKKKRELQAIKGLYVESFRREAIVAEAVKRLIGQFIEIRLDEVTFINLINIIVSENSDMNKDYCALIIAHGYATASSMANASNKLLGRHVFDAIDMPLDTDPTDIAKKIDSYIEDSVFVKNLILIVDMGSLEEISSLIGYTERIKIGLINNVSTRLCLLIGEGIINEKSMEEIMGEACGALTTSYEILTRKSKEKAILFVSEAGEVISDRIIQLFKKSLPRPTEARIMPYDYFELIKNGENDIIFERYDIRLIVGIDRKIANCPFVPLEELITTEGNSVFDNVLKGLSFQEEEVKVFNGNILKYFTLENVMNSITILNANILIDLIEDALKKLQKALYTKLNAKVMYGLYIHLSSLVERLVIKSSGSVYNNIDEFETTQEKFIDSVRSSFEKLMNYYNIEIPLSEIAYLYDYIKKWK